ncbi:MAG: hypothetical protein QHH74_07820 [Spirochaetota bacterium]|nr:hypothetical protein [Spirochaetota bacterium]
MKKFSFLLLFIFYSSMCMAKVIVEGLTVPVDIAEIENQSVTSESQAKVQAIALTNKLHEAGYTTSYVKRYYLEGDICYLYVVESHIADIQLTANSGVKEAIMQDLQKLLGTVYNRKTVHALFLQLKEKYILDSIQVNVANYKEGDDVSLIIHVRAKKLVFSFEVNTLPIYGITPSMTLSLPLYRAVITGQGQIGFNEERVTVKKGVLEYMSYPATIGWHAGLLASQEYAVWERYGDFTVTIAKPYAGIGIFSNIGVFDISVFLYGVGTYYRVSEQHAVPLHNTYNNAGLQLNFRATDDRSIAKKNKALNATLYAGVSQDENVLMSRASAYIPLQLTMRLYVVPSCYSFYTNSLNRIYAEYVFDSYLLGYARRYTATHSRHIAKLELMYELLYEFVYFEIFASSGVYKSECVGWDRASSYGAGADVYYNTILFTIGCAWNTDEQFGEYYIYSGIKSSW